MAKNRIQTISIDLGEEEIEILTKKAEKNLLSLKEQIEDILRLSVLRSKKRPYSSQKPDDTLVAIFSREKKGRKRRSKHK